MLLLLLLLLLSGPNASALGFSRSLSIALGPIASISGHSQRESQHRIGLQRQHVQHCWAVAANRKVAQGRSNSAWGSRKESRHRTGPKCQCLILLALISRGVAWQRAQEILENGKPPFPREGGFPLYVPRITNVSPLLSFSLSKLAGDCSSSYSCKKHSSPASAGICCPNIVWRAAKHACLRCECVCPGRAKREGKTMAFIGGEWRGAAACGSSRVTYCATIVEIWETCVWCECVRPRCAKREGKTIGFIGEDWGKTI